MALQFKGGKAVDTSAARIADMEKAERMLKGSVLHNIGTAQGQVWPSHYTDSLSQSVMTNVDKLLRKAELDIAKETDRLTQEIFRLK